ncbi:MAG: acyl-CoA/acyl-ACP dehydrogenase [Dehalococcoidales bacterium]|nr:acyl-CoA/acyl-ACP dehydrogenase [Dehalococcoidales bacterium]
MDFALDEEQLMLQQSIRRLIQKEVKPILVDYYNRRDPKDPRPGEIRKKLHDMGLYSLGFDTKWGGTGASLVTQAMVCEELGAGDPAFSGGMSYFLQMTHFMEVFLNDDQKAEWYPQIMSDPYYVIGNCTSEEESSSDATLPYDEPGAAIKTFVQPDGDDYLINGKKYWVTGGASARLYIVWCRSDKNLPMSECFTPLMVPRETPGVSIGSLHELMNADRIGNPASAEVIFENVRVPKRNLVGEYGKMFWPRMNEFVHDYVCNISNYLGVARNCYDLTLEYAKTRIQGGKPIIEHPNIAIKVAEMYEIVEACRLFIRKAAWSWDTKKDYNRAMPFLTKSFVSDSLAKFYLNALDIWGGPGAVIESPIQRAFRYHFARRHGAGTPDFCRIRAARLL